MRILWFWSTILVIVTSLVLTPGECARILAILPTLSRSHHIFNSALMNGLAARGHEIIAVSPDREANKPNLTYIHLEDTYEAFEAEVSLADWASYSPKENIDGLYDECLELAARQFQTDGFKQLLALKGPFDLLIVEAVLSECFYGIIPRFGAPVVAVSAYGYGFADEQLGIPSPMAVFPLTVLPYTTKMSFLQRFHNVVLSLYNKYKRDYYYLPAMEKLARSVFGEKMPPLAEIERNFSVFLGNSGPGMDSPRARPPAVIEVGCLHCRPGKPLQKDIQMFLDGATEGAIFFSLGSNVRSDKMLPETIQAILTVFSTLKQRVLWKWESDTLPGQPDNVMVGKWLPQQDILAHPNVRYFITHGGRLSTLESVYHGVPVLAMPVFFDQHTNARRVEELGLGLRLDLASVTEESLSNVLHQLLHDDKYLAKARHTSQVSRDQPESAMDRAVFWTEYVIRHKGAPHLRSAALDLAWYQLYLLDVMALLAVVPLVLVLATTCLVRCAVRPRDSLAVAEKKKRR